jgi:hypothetical protein
MPRKAVRVDRIPEGGRRPRQRTNWPKTTSFSANKINGASSCTKLVIRGLGTISRPAGQSPVRTLDTRPAPILIGREEAVELYEIPAKTIARYIRDGKLPNMVMAGPRYLFRSADLRRLLRARRTFQDAAE